MSALHHGSTKPRPNQGVRLDEPIHAPTESDLVDIAEFKAGLLLHVKQFHRRERQKLRDRWEFAVWFRPYIQHGGDRHGGVDNFAKARRNAFHLGPNEPRTWDPRQVFEDLRAAGLVSYRWGTLIKYLPLAEYTWGEIIAHNWKVKQALEWCRDQKRTPEERVAREGKLEAARQAKRAAKKEGAPSAIEWQALKTENEEMRREMAHMRLTIADLRRRLAVAESVRGPRPKAGHLSDTLSFEGEGW